MINFAHQGTLCSPITKTKRKKKYYSKCMFKINIKNIILGGDDSSMPPILTHIVSVYIIGRYFRPALRGLALHFEFY